jgi:hypothetical protein
VAELQSALTIGAGLANSTGGRLVMDLTTLGKMTAEESANNHVILIGKAASFPMLNQLQLPLSPTDGKFQSPGAGEEDGIVQMVHSPWSPARVVFLVSGNTDLAVVKAAQAVSTGNLRSNTASNLSIIGEVQADTLRPLPKTDQTLLDLGYATTVFERRGTLAPGAYFELAFGNSALLDYGRSGLNVRVNGQPVGSVRFTDATGSQSVNRTQITIPASVISPGTNNLEIIAGLQPLDDCSGSQLHGIWANIWSDSRLHLPLIVSTVAPAASFDLAEYPAPLSFEPSLSSVGFVLQKDNVESWQLALKVAGYLGERSNGSITLLNAYYADDVPDDARNNLNLVIIGNATQMPVIGELNDFLPAPFDDASGIATERDMQVTFRIPSNSPVGYVELLQSPWNRERIIIAALGNTSQGVAWAASGLYVSKIYSRMAGNFAVINDQQVTTTDTRLAPPEAGVSPDQPDVVVVPPVVTPEPFSNVGRPSWMLPAVVASVVLTVFVGLWVISRSVKRSRTHRNIYRTSADD